MVNLFGSSMTLEQQWSYLFRMFITFYYKYLLFIQQVILNVQLMIYYGQVLNMTALSIIFSH